MKATPGSISGTKIILLEGGPEEWDGVVAGVSKKGGGRAVRWDHTADLAVVYAATDRTAPVDLERKRRAGTVIETKPAQVYEYIGYQDELGLDEEEPCSALSD